MSEPSMPAKRALRRVEWRRRESFHPDLQIVESSRKIEAVKQPKTLKNLGPGTKQVQSRSRRGVAGLRTVWSWYLEILADLSGEIVVDVVVARHGGRLAA
jgi:hypothetical protein